MKINSVVQLPPEDSGLQHCIARFHNHNMDAKKQDLSRFFRREPLIFRNPETGAKVLRYAMGNPGGISITKTSVALDYDAVDALGVGFKGEVDLEVRRAKRWEVWQWFWFHADLNVQIAIRVGTIGAILGILGFTAAVVPLVLA